jgi:hypothetical protein
MLDVSYQLDRQCNIGQTACKREWASAVIVSRVEGLAMALFSLIFAHIKNNRNGADYDRAREQSCRSNRAQLTPPAITKIGCFRGPMSSGGCGPYQCLISQ